MLKKLMKDRKGIERKILVGLIITITTIIILLFFLGRGNLYGETNKQLCRNSVELRDKTEGVSGPLNCKTNYLCISGGEDCQEISATEKVEVNPENKEEIMNAIAKEMASCWYMFGEDKELKYAGGPGLTGGIDCAICSIIEFDPKIQEKIIKIDYSEFYAFLEKTKKDNFQNYLKYLYGVSDVDDLVIQEQFKIVDIKNDFISTRERYSLITGIDTSESISGLFREWLKVYIIPTIETPATSCTNFITKA